MTDPDPEFPATAARILRGATRLLEGLGYAALAEMGQRAKAVSSFAVRNYGFTRLSDLIKAVPNFQTKVGEDGRLMVKRLR